METSIFDLTVQAIGSEGQRRVTDQGGEHVNNVTRMGWAAVFEPVGPGHVADVYITDPLSSSLPLPKCVKRRKARHNGSALDIVDSVAAGGS
jgi:hypothetical protein